MVIFWEGFLLPTSQKDLGDGMWNTILTAGYCRQWCQGFNEQKPVSSWAVFYEHVQEPNGVFSNLGKFQWFTVLPVFHSLWSFFFRMAIWWYALISRPTYICFRWYPQNEICLPFFCHGWWTSRAIHSNRYWFIDESQHLQAVFFLLLQPWNLLAIMLPGLVN